MHDYGQGCSSLNQHLSSKNITDNPLCVCGSAESTKHYIRTNMINIVSVYCTPSLNVLLSGDSHLDNYANERIFLAVQRFIDDSRRFHTWGAFLLSFLLYIFLFFLFVLLNVLACYYQVRILRLFFIIIIVLFFLGLPSVPECSDTSLLHTFSKLEVYLVN